MARSVDVQLVNAAEQAFNEAYPTLTRCMFCDWTHEGTAADGRLEAKRHRARKHRRLPKRSYNSHDHARFQKIKAAELSPEDQERIQMEINKRRFLAGVDG